MADKKVPELRFKGFTDDWELCKFSNILRKDNGIRRGPFGSTLKKDLFVSNSDYVVYEQQNAIYDRFNTRYNISEEKFNELSNFEIVPGDFIMSGAGTIGRIAKVPENIKRGVFNQALIRFKLDFKKSDSVFFLQLMRSEKMQRKLTSSNSGSAMMNLVPMSELKRWKIYIPSVSEQIKIGEFLSGIDNAITLHQRKLEQLKSLKQAYLQKMFPSDTEKVPKLRFANFTDSWELCKFREMAESFEYGLNSAATEYDGENKYIRITDIDDGSREFIQTGLTSPDTDLEKADNYLLKKGDILFARTGASVGKSYRYSEKDGRVFYAGFLIRARVKSEFDSEFIFQNTLTMTYDNFVRITSQRSGQPGINANEYANFEFFVPSKHEQSEIGKLFKSIDKTIALHQQKIDSLKKIKRAFLQIMFI